MLVLDGVLSAETITFAPSVLATNNSVQIVAPTQLYLFVSCFAHKRDFDNSRYGNVLVSQTLVNITESVEIYGAF